MKRILLVMAVGLVMAAVVVAMSMPALAANCPGNPNCNGPGKSEGSSGNPPVVTFQPGHASER